MSETQIWFSWQYKKSCREPNLGLGATLEKPIKTHMALNLLKSNFLDYLEKNK